VIKTCIIGVSGYGRIHYDLLMKAHGAGKVDIVGATIINQDEEAGRCAHLREVGCRIYDDYEEMLKELAGIAEFCMIPTGIPLHRPMTVAALETGMHVLVEKPVAGCMEDARAMQAAEEKAGRIVAVGYQHMYAPSVLATKRHILDGTIGRLESAKCLVTWPRDHAYYNRNGWAGKLNADGIAINDSPFNNAVAHELMMMLFQTGDTERGAAMPFSVEAELYRANRIESTDTACLRIETTECVPILFHATHACQETFGPEIRIQGTKGSILMTQSGSVIMPDGKPAIELHAGDVRKAMMAAVLDAVTGGDAFICDLDLAVSQTAVVDQIREGCRIADVPGERVGNRDGSTFIPGIEEAMREAWDKDLLLCEAGFSLCGE